jgi:hypothetical protein
MEHTLYVKYLGWCMAMVFNTIIKKISALSWGISFIERRKPVILTFVSTVYSFTYIRGRCGRYRMVVRLKTTYVISAHHLRLSISNPVQDDVYSIQPCVIK